MRNFWLSFFPTFLGFVFIHSIIHFMIEQKKRREDDVFASKNFIATLSVFFSAACRWIRLNSAAVVVFSSSTFSELHLSEYMCFYFDFGRCVCIFSHFSTKAKLLTLPTILTVAAAAVPRELNEMKQMETKINIIIFYDTNFSVWKFIVVLFHFLLSSFRKASKIHLLTHSISLVLALFVRCQPMAILSHLSMTIFQITI